MFRQDFRQIEMTELIVQVRTLVMQDRRVIV